MVAFGQSHVGVLEMGGGGVFTDVPVATGTEWP